MEVKCPQQVSDNGGNAFTAECDGKILLLCCEIVGGSDGLALLNRLTEMHMKETDISNKRKNVVYWPTHTFSLKIRLYIVVLDMELKDALMVGEK